MQYYTKRHSILYYTNNILVDFSRGQGQVSGSHVSLSQTAGAADKEPLPLPLGGPRPR